MDFLGEIKVLNAVLHHFRHKTVRGVEYIFGDFFVMQLLLSIPMESFPLTLLVDVTDHRFISEN